jgi:predicted metal-dependent hydrolase
MKSSSTKSMDRFMLHLKNSKYLPKDATTILHDSRDLIYGITAVIRDCRVSSKFVELDISVHKNNLELLVEKLSSIGKTDNSRLIIEEEIEKEQLVKDGVSYFNNERFWECHEALEGAWKQSNGEEKELIQGLILVAAALVHYQKAEDDICLSVLGRALEKLHDKSGQYYRINVDDVKQKVIEMLDKKEIFTFIF